MARGCTFCLLLLTCSQSRRFGDEDVDRVVFGEPGDSLYFLAPELPQGAQWHDRSSSWPKGLAWGSKVSLLGDTGARTGFVLKKFARTDEGRLYSITTNSVVTNYRAALANRIEVDVGTTLHITPLFDGEIKNIIWKYTSTSTTKSTDFVEALGHGAFNNRIFVHATTGKLAVREWTPFDDGYFTAEINGKPFAENFRVVSIVRVVPGGELHLDPHFVGRISEFSWYRDNELVVEYIAGGGNAVYTFPHCVINKSNCFFDVATGKLKIKSWQHSLDGIFTMMINGKTYQNRIKVVGDVIFAINREKLQLDPPPLSEQLTSIRWQHGGNLVVELTDDGGVETFKTCETMGCSLDTITGTLTISTWYALDTERYVLDVNGWRQPHEYLVAGVAKLDEYEAIMITQYISNTRTMLICEGDFDAAEPVKYLWRSHGSTSNWVEGTYKMETPHFFAGQGRRANYLYDACKVKNPVSEIDRFDSPTQFKKVKSHTIYIAIIVIIHFLMFFPVHESNNK